MTRLAAVLAGALVDSDLIRRYVEYAEKANPTTMPEGLISDGHLAHDWAEALVAAIPEPVREAIEAALDVCAVCGMWPGWGDHDDNPGFRAAVGGSFHPYQPLVAP